MPITFAVRGPVALGGAAVSLDAIGSLVQTVTSTNNDCTFTVGSGATLLIAVVASRTNSGDVGSVNWDATGTPQSMTPLIDAENTGAGGGAQVLIIYGLLNPNAVNGTLRVVSNGAGSVYAVGGASFKNTSVASIGAAVTVGGTTGSGPGLAPRTDTLTVAANSYGLIANKTNNFNSNGSQWTPAPNEGVDGSSLSSSRVGFITGTGSMSFQIDMTTGTEDDACGICIQINHA